MSRITKEQQYKDWKENPPANYQEARARLSPRERRFVDELPGKAYDYVKAGIAAGYSRSYSETQLAPRFRHDQRICKTIDLYREEVGEITWTIEGWYELIKEGRRKALEKGDLNTVKGYDDMIARHIGSYDADNRQRSDKIAILLR